jgi:hypothetical protein
MSTLKINISLTWNEPIKTDPKQIRYLVPTRLARGSPPQKLSFLGEKDRLSPSIWQHDPVTAQDLLLPFFSYCSIGIAGLDIPQCILSRAYASQSHTVVTWCCVVPFFWITSNFDVVAVSQGYVFILVLGK